MIIQTNCLPDNFPSSEAFDAINKALSSSDAERKSAIKKGQAVFAFTLKNKSGETADWHIDLKEKGTVGEGLGNNPSGMCLILCRVPALSARTLH